MPCFSASSKRAALRLYENTVERKRVALKLKYKLNIVEKDENRYNVVIEYNVRKCTINYS